MEIDGPFPGLPHTETLIMCSTTTLKAWVPPNNQSFHPITYPPKWTKANHLTYNRVRKAFKVPAYNIQYPLAIYCPPRMRYIHMALRFLGLELHKHEQNPCHIRFDDRLLDRKTTFDGIPDRMEGYHRDLEEAADSSDPLVRRIIEAIDMNWLEQRIDCVTLPSYQPLSQVLDWSTIFRQNRDEEACAGIIVMAGEETCRALCNSAPVMPPDNFRGDGRVYRLRELEGADYESKFRWKAEHYCNIAVDKDFDWLG